MSSRSNSLSNDYEQPPQKHRTASTISEGAQNSDEEDAVLVIDPANENSPPTHSLRSRKGALIVATKSTTPAAAVTFHVRITGSENRTVDKSASVFTCYIVEVRYQQAVWSVARRYNEFITLHRKVQEILRLDSTQLPAFPPKQILNKFSPDFIEARRKGLETYLQAIVTQPLISCSIALHSFLDVQSSPVSFAFAFPGESDESLSETNTAAITIRKRKRQLKEMIEKQRIAIDNYDNNNNSNNSSSSSNESSGAVTVVGEAQDVTLSSPFSVNGAANSSSDSSKLSDHEQYWYERQFKILEELKTELSNLRLEADNEFRVLIANKPHTIAISAESKVYIFPQQLRHQPFTSTLFSFATTPTSPISNSDVSRTDSPRSASSSSTSPFPTASASSLSTSDSSHSIAANESNDSAAVTLAGSHRISERFESAVCDVKKGLRKLSFYVDEIKNVTSNNNNYRGDGYEACYITLKPTARLNNPSLGTDSKSQQQQPQQQQQQQQQHHHQTLEVLALERQELVEVIGSHLRHGNKQRVSMVAYLRAIGREKSVRYDRNNSEHESLLLKLWSLLRPNETLDGRVSKKWTTLGFQGSDPSTDFRGMGLLGLKMLIYCATQYTADVTAVLDANREYPWAVAGINLIQLVLDMLGLETNKSALFDEPPSSLVWDSPLFYLMCLERRRRRTNAPFEEMFCIAWFIFDKLWVERGGTYMRFGEIYAETKQRIAEALATRPLSFAMLRQSATTTFY